MSSQNINKNFSLAAEPYEKKVRLIVIKDGDEYFCRKETLGNLKKFLLADESHIFKGRLQLIKKQNTINIQAKGDLIGAISTKDFSHIIHKLTLQVNFQFYTLHD